MRAGKAPSSCIATVDILNSLCKFKPNSGAPPLTITMWSQCKDTCACMHLLPCQTPWHGAADVCFMEGLFYGLTADVCSMEGLCYGLTADVCFMEGLCYGLTAMRCFIG